MYLGRQNRPAGNSEILGHGGILGGSSSIKPAGYCGLCYIYTRSIPSNGFSKVPSKHVSHDVRFNLGHGKKFLMPGDSTPTSSQVSVPEPSISSQLEVTSAAVNFAHQNIVSLARPQFKYGPAAASLASQYRTNLAYVVGELDELGAIEQKLSDLRDEVDIALENQ